MPLGSRHLRGASLTTRIAIIAIFTTAALQPLAGLAQPPDNASTNRLPVVAALEQTLVDAIARAEPSVVAISRTTPAAAAAAAQPPLLADDVFRELRPANLEASVPPVVAAGVLIDKSGLVLTQYLAVHEGDAHTITTIDGKTYPATIHAADPRSGLAVLAMGSRNSPARTGSAATNAAPAASFPAIRWAMPPGFARANS